MRWAAALVAGVLVVGLAGCKERVRPAVAPAPPAPVLRLLDQNARPVSERDLLGKPTLLFFGFTYCPDICPTTLANLTSLMKALGPDADRINVAFVSVDPERDTPKQLHDYLSVFDPRIRAFTGAPEAVAKFARDHDAPYRKVSLPEGGYTMEHSPLIYMLDAQGKIVGVMSHNQPAADAVPRVRELLAS